MAHNLAVLLEENRQIRHQRAAGTYATWHEGHFENSICLPPIRQLLNQQNSLDTL